MIHRTIKIIVNSFIVFTSLKNISPNKEYYSRTSTRDYVKKIPGFSREITYNCNKGNAFADIIKIFCKTFTLFFVHDFLWWIRLRLNPPYPSDFWFWIYDLKKLFPQKRQTAALNFTRSAQVLQIFFLPMIKRIMAPISGEVKSEITKTKRKELFQRLPHAAIPAHNIIHKKPIKSNPTRKAFAEFCSIIFNPTYLINGCISPCSPAWSKQYLKR